MTGKGILIVLSAATWCSAAPASEQEPFGPRVTSIIVQEIAYASKPGGPNVRNAAQQAMIETLEALAEFEKAENALGPADPKRKALMRAIKDGQALRGAFNEALLPALRSLAVSFDFSRFVTTQTALTWTNRRLASMGAPREAGAPACPGEETLRTLDRQNKHAHGLASQGAKVSKAVSRRLKRAEAAAQTLEGTDAGVQLAEAVRALREAAELAQELSRRQMEITAKRGSFAKAIERAGACGAGADWKAGADDINDVTERMVRDIEMLMGSTPVEAVSFNQFLKAVGEL